SAGGAAGGSAGGTAGGSAGGTAGGSAGGTAGGSAGGTAGGGAVMQDTYVCVTCPGSLDTNPGTQASPLRTIARGVQQAAMLGRPTVFVGGASGQQTSYAEDLTIPAGVTVQGRWIVNNGTWARSGTRTILINTTVTGVKFAPGATRSSGLDGVRVQSSGAVGGAMNVAAITVFDASPTLRDVEVDPPGGNLPQPTLAAGVVIVGSAGGLVRPSPLITGSTSGTRSNIQAGPAASSSIGISVTNAAAEIEFTDTLGGTSLNAGSSSVGISLNAAVGTAIRSSSASAGQSLQCGGVVSRGDASGVLLQGVEANGCRQGPGTGASNPNQTVGIAFSGCTSGPGLTSPRVTGSTARGGVAQGTNSFAVGILASDGCALQIDSNASIVGSNAVNIVPNLAAGVLCTHETAPTVAGANAACRITNNARSSGGAAGISSGRGLTNSFGIACIGNCGTGNAQCTGSCAEVSGNLAEGGEGANTAHLWVSQSSPRIARNVLGGDGASCGFASGIGASQLVGLHLDGSASRVENNLIQGGQCSRTIGLEQVNVRRTGDNSFPAPDIHSNTIVPVAPGFTSAGIAIYGVLLRTPTSGPGPVPMPLATAIGVYRNNIITAFGTAQARAAFREDDALSDPAVLENNNFWAGSSPVIQPPLYVNEGATPPLTGAGQINNLGTALPLVITVNNLSQDPGFSTGYRLSPTSPMRGAGTVTGAPTDDIDGQRRPNPLTTPPDVGCDEVQ
ncbi:MAG: hypothetical protein SFW67_30930, partial [Myxococcaceae bacterium]|nr:hypothetical protein [Myxococcaceae bacterium]